MWLILEGAKTYIPGKCLGKRRMFFSAIVVIDGQMGRQTYIDNNISPSA